MWKKRENRQIINKKKKKQNFELKKLRRKTKKLIKIEKS